MPFFHPYSPVSLLYSSYLISVLLSFASFHYFLHLFLASSFLRLGVFLLLVVLFLSLHYLTLVHLFLFFML
jgi:hypothetical protein